jgi:hypothetical protein
MNGEQITWKEVVVACVDVIRVFWEFAWKIKKKNNTEKIQSAVYDSKNVYIKMKLKNIHFSNVEYFELGQKLF